MIPQTLTLDAIQSAFRDIYAKMAPLQTGNLDLRGRRITGAGLSVDKFDYWTRLEHDRFAAELEAGVVAVRRETALTIKSDVRVGTFATRGSAVAHNNEAFVASDLDYIGWVSSGGVWKYAFGIRAVALTNLAAFVALLTANDDRLLIEVTDYDHVLQWTGTALTWGPGEVGSGFYQMFEATPSSLGALAWQICDGSTVARLNADGTTTNVTVPNVTTAAYLKAGITAAAIAAASGLTTNVSGGTPAGAVSAIAATATAAITSANAAGQNTADNLHTHPAPTFTGSALAGHDHGPNTLELRNKQAILHYRR